jgi:hypothetical protein
MTDEKDTTERAEADAPEDEAMRALVKRSLSS